MTRQTMRSTPPAVAHDRVSVPLISQASSEQSICFAIPDEATDQVVAGLEEEFADELARRDVDRIWAQRGVAIMEASSEFVLSFFSVLTTLISWP